MRSLYGPMVDTVRDALGIELQLADTGGGCTALIGQCEGDYAVYVTDAPNSPYGHEAHISDMEYRERHNGLVGYAVGVYVDDHQTQVAYGDYPYATVFDLPGAIARELLNARRAA